MDEKIDEKDHVEFATVRISASSLRPIDRVLQVRNDGIPYSIRVMEESPCCSNLDFDPDDEEEYSNFSEQCASNSSAQATLHKDGEDLTKKTAETKGMMIRWTWDKSKIRQRKLMASPRKLNVCKAPRRLLMEDPVISKEDINEVPIENMGDSNLLGPAVMIHVPKRVSLNFGI